MRKYYYLLLLISGFANAQLVSIPDENFKNALLTTAYAEDADGNQIAVDSDSSGEIEESEAAAIALLNVDSFNIADLTGIEAFVNLKHLICTTNPIINLTLTMVPSLERVYCGSNELAFINVSGLPNILEVNFGISPNLVHVDYSNCPVIGSFNGEDLQELEYLDVSNSGVFYIVTESPALNFIDFYGCPNLTNINIWYSALTSLTLKDMTAEAGMVTLYQNLFLNELKIINCPFLSYLNCDTSVLTSLDLSGAPNLGTLYCNSNHLTTLDISFIPNLFALNCSNNLLETLFIKNGQTNMMLQFANNPTLEYICANESQIASIQNTLNTAGMSSTVCNSYCSFEPGGVFNTITGKIKSDSDNNGCDAADALYPFIKMNINNGTDSGSTVTNLSGDYTFYTGAGNFTLTPQIENPDFFTISPPNAVVNFAGADNSVSNPDFCITPNGMHTDLEIIIAPVIPARPGFNAIYKIVYKNKGNQTMSLDYGVSFFYNHNLMTFVSANVAPDTFNLGALNWSYTNLKPFETRSVLVTMNINPPTDSVNPVNINDILVFNSAIGPIGSDENQFDNYGVLNQVVVGSFDPNDIQCLEGNIVSPTEIGKYLHYVIRFENTGTAAAENIVVKTDINPADFDVNTVQLLSASHPVDARVHGNTVEFIFKNIMLDSGGHGNILLKVRSKENLQTGDAVSKKANIFFDYNFPVLTNEAETVFQNLSIGDVKDSSVTLYPNPVNDRFTVKAASQIKAVQFYDAQGRLLMATVVNQKESVLDISSYPPGMYFLKIATENGIATQKIMKK